jgi:hypothetical protein
MVYYMHYLGAGQREGDLDEKQASSADDQEHHVTDEVSQHDDKYPGRPLFLMAGYSYGSMIASQLPPLEDMLENFATPAAGSDTAQIRLRAESLAIQQVAAYQEAARLDRARGGHRAGHSREPSSPSRMEVRVGGTEGVRRAVGDDVGGGGSPTRKSRDSRDGDEGKRRRAMSDLLAKTRRGGRHHNKSWSVSTEKQAASANGALPVASDLVMPRSAFLLVSPVPGLVTRLLTLSLLPSFGRSQSTSGTFTEGDDNSTSGSGNNSYEEKLARHPTLAIYGDSDTFVSAAKMRSWVERVKLIAGQRQSQQQSRGAGARPTSSSTFQAEEIATAGHFWIEEGVLDKMLGFVSRFAGELVDGRL